MECITTERNRIWSDLRPPFLSLQTFTRPAGWEMGEHSHSFYQLIYVTGGVLNVGWGQRVFQVSRGQAHLLPPGFSHWLSSPGGYVQLGLDMDTQPDARDIVSLLRDYFPEPVVISCPEALSLAEGLFRAPSAFSRIERARLMTRLDSLVFFLLDAQSHTERESFDLRLCAYLDGHLNESVTLEEISAQFFLSPAQLERLTHRYFGCGVMEMRSRRREAEAKALLLSSAESIAGIAETLGFCDAAHFCHFFKKRCGLSPGNYRRLAQDGGDKPGTFPEKTK